MLLHVVGLPPLGSPALPRDITCLYLSICRSICLAIYLAIYLPTYLSIYLRVHIRVYMYIYIHTHMYAGSCRRGCEVQLKGRHDYYVFVPTNDLTYVSLIITDPTIMVVL